MPPTLLSRRPERRGLRLWPVGIVLALAFAAALTVTASVFFTGWDLLGARSLKTERELTSGTLFDLVKLSFGVVAGAGALVALVVAYRRQRIDEDGALRDATRLHTERFTTAVSQLGEDSAAVRLGGVHALAGLADDAPTRDLRQTCIDVLCAYLRLPYTAEADIRPDDAEALHSYQSLREVRHTIIRLIRDHLRLPAKHSHSWQDHDLDFTGVVFDGGDFSDATFSGFRVSFNGAQFTGGTVLFSGARFIGKAVYFDDAQFIGGTVTFNRAQFIGGAVTFNAAQFTRVTFTAACFTGATVYFDGVRFTGTTVGFHRARFADGTVTFFDAKFTGSAVFFNGAHFNGARVTFIGAQFTDKAVVHFTGAQFIGGTVNCNGAQFTGATVYFGNVRFTDGTMDFSGAEFTGDTVYFIAVHNTGDTGESSGLNVVLPSSRVHTDGCPLPVGLRLPPEWLTPTH